VPGATREEKPRYHAFDALRGLAMFLVIGLHAALGYLERDIPSVLWCVRDSPTLPAFDWFCWWSMGVSNPLYFTIAGFFAVSLYNSRGTRGFLINRARRVLIPFLIGAVTVLPTCLVAWSYGWLVSGRCTWKEFRRLRFRDPAIQAERLGSGHLWFLEYLILMLVAYAACRWLVERRGAGRLPFRALVDRVLGSPWRPLLLAVPTTALLWLSHRQIGIDAALDRHNSFLINPLKMLHNASFFVAGLGLYRLRHDLERLARPFPIYLALSVPVFAGRAWLLGRDWTSPLRGPSSVAMAALGALFSWLVVFGAIGAAVRWVRRPSPTLRYLADSSFWIYLVHMPILGLIQVDLYRIPGHALWKCPIVLAGTLAIGFASYQTLVRHTAIGTGLHGLRESPTPRGR
jgi:peptidoglycan/LPS O-acetylase OafA/YrhL